MAFDMNSDQLTLDPQSVQNICEGLRRVTPNNPFTFVNINGYEKVIEEAKFGNRNDDEYGDKIDDFRLRSQNTFKMCTGLSFDAKISDKSGSVKKIELHKDSNIMQETYQYRVSFSFLGPSTVFLNNSMNHSLYTVPSDDEDDFIEYGFEGLQKDMAEYFKKNSKYPLISPEHNQIAIWNVNHAIHSEPSMKSDEKRYVIIFSSKTHPQSMSSKMMSDNPQYTRDDL